MNVILIDFKLSKNLCFLLFLSFNSNIFTNILIYEYCASLINKNFNTKKLIIIKITSIYITNLATLIFICAGKKKDGT